MLTDFDRWVNEHGLAKDAPHAALFWGYVETVRRFAEKFDVEAASVAGTYPVAVASASDELILPVAVLEMAKATLALRWNAEAWPNEWTLSVERRSPYKGPVLGLFDPTRDLRESALPGLAPDYLFPPLSESPSRFTCELYDEWDVATLARLVAWEE